MGILVAEETLEVDVVALVLARSPVGTGSFALKLVGVEVIETRGLVPLELGQLLGPQRGHGHGEGGVDSRQLRLGLGLRDGDFARAGGSAAGQQGDEERSDSLHDGTNAQCRVRGGLERHRKGMGEEVCVERGRATVPVKMGPDGGDISTFWSRLASVQQGSRAVCRPAPPVLRNQAGQADPLQGSRLFDGQVQW